jgi:ribonuclease HI
MSKAEVLTIHTDGAARGNPGPAAFAYVIDREGQPPIEEAGCLGKTTNNQAEYTALVRALEHAARLGTRHRLIVHSDSELMVKQMKGEYRVKDPGLRPLYETAKELADRFESVTFRHVRREQNRRADQLCNEALDRRRETSPPPLDLEESPAAGDPLESLHEEAVAFLRAVASAWARGKQDDPAPYEVWQYLCKLLEERGLLPGKGPR